MKAPRTSPDRRVAARTRRAAAAKLAGETEQGIGAQMRGGKPGGANPRSACAEHLCRRTGNVSGPHRQSRIISPESRRHPHDFPDWKGEVLEMVAEGDVVVVRVRVSGTHEGVGKRPINGGMLVGVPPTGKRFGSTYSLVENTGRKDCGAYAVRDDIGMMRQLGLLPPPSAPK
jgi:predicted ester cyclase